MMRPSPRQSGYVLVAALALVTIIALLTMISATVSLRASTSNRTESRKSQAFYAAQTGLERAINRASASQNQVMPGTVTTAAQAATWLASQLNGMSDTLPGGRFIISTTVDTSGTQPKVVISSQGVPPSGSGLRRLRSAMPITLITTRDQVDPLIGGAPAALTITGNSGINGSAPVAGDNAAPGVKFNMQCPPSLRTAGTCVKSGTNPDRYRLTYQGAIPSTFVPGRAIRPTAVPSGQTSEERYLVNSVNGQDAELTVLSDAIRQTNGTYVRRTFAATGDIEMQELNSIPAVLMPIATDFSKISANVRDTCNTYECGRYTMTNEELFRMIMGGNKDEIQSKFLAKNTALPGSYVTGQNIQLQCTGPAAQWLRLSEDKVALDECNNGKLIVVDARGLNNGTKSIDINIPTQETFRGLLYVITNPGVEVKMTGNVGFAGAVVMDNGDGGIDMTGNGNFNDDCKDVAAEDGLKKDPKLCYDREILGNLKSDYIDNYFTNRLLNLEIRASQWQEVAEP